MPYYEQLLEEKKNGTLFPFDEITKDQLAELWTREHLSDAAIADLFRVPKSRVTQKRRSFALTMFDGTAQFLQDHIEGHPERYNTLAREALSLPASRGQLAIGLTRYVFRDGPVEDMHTAGQLSQEDMRTLNQFTANRIATVIYLMEEGRWKDLYTLLERYMGGAGEWDEPEVDQEAVKRLGKNRKGLRHN